MSSVSELKIIIPGICGPLAETDSLKEDPVVTNWINVLSKSQKLPAKKSFNDVVSSLFEIDAGIDEEGDFPSAALSLIANEKFDPSLYYMHADPVFLRADMDHAVLTSSADLDIKEEDSNALCEALNSHFSQDGLTFFKLNKDQWFVSSKNKIKLKTTSLVDATGRNINFILPAGDDSSYWKSILTEAQMLMYAHETNKTREESGLLTVNSLWFHGSGEIGSGETGSGDICSRVVASGETGSIAAAGINSLCSNDDMLMGLAKQIGCNHIEVPDSVNTYLDFLLSCEADAVNLLHLSELEHLTNYTDTGLWLEQLAQILDHWVYPLFKMASKNNIDVTLYACNGKKYQISKHDNLKFWRKSILEDYVNSY